MAQYFSCCPVGTIMEAFAFIYRDPECARLFSSRAPALDLINLWPCPRNTGQAWDELWTLFFRLPILQARLFRLVRHRRIDVVVTHGFQAALVVWPMAIICRKIRWVYIHRITKSKRIWNFLFCLLYLPFHAVAGNSRAVAASLAPFVSARRLSALENGLDAQRFKARAIAGSTIPMPEIVGPVIVAVGRLLPHKGQAMLIDAFELVANRFPKATLWVAGEGPEMQSLRQRALASPVASRIEILGHREDVPALLARADVFVNTSAWEGMSNAVLEGMAAGLPSVVCDAPGVTECHIDEVTALVVKRDPGDLAAALVRLLKDPELSRRMGGAARERVQKNYSMEANRRRYLELFERLTGRNVCAES